MAGSLATLGWIVLVSLYSGSVLSVLTAQVGSPVIRRIGPKSLAHLLHKLPDPGHGPEANVRPRIMLTGYWPPTNEMLRRFSTNKSQNAAGWIGANWENRGYDVHAFFPEFPANNRNRGVGDFEVDYQDTSNDFWPITKSLKPIAIITFSRGGLATQWEVELNAHNGSSWVNDFLTPRQPTPKPPDSRVPPNTIRRSTLPGPQIVTAVANANLGLSPFICVHRNAGSFVSEYMSYHGLWYQGLHHLRTDPAWCIAAGHIHVGSRVPVSAGTKAVEVTLRELIANLNRVIVGTCQQDIGYGGLGTSLLSMCGTPLKRGGKQDLLLTGLPPNAAALLVLGTKATPTYFQKRLFVPIPTITAPVFFSDSNGQIRIVGILGGGGPFSIFAQSVYLDSRAPGGFGMSNAIAIQFLK